MNKNLLIGIVIAVIIIAGGGLYLTRSSNQTPTSTTSGTPELPDINVTEPSDTKSFLGLMQGIRNQMCTFKDEAQNAGAMYSGNGKVRADFTGNAGGTVTNTHMISDGTNVYLWFDGATDGIKMTLEDIEKDTANATNTAKSIDVNKQVDYNCSPWSVDNSKFSLPNITFNDLGAMIENSIGEIPDGTTPFNPSDPTASQCAACASLPPEAATQCRQALNCS